jgi:Ca2+-binding EF-hand superfamily protein
MNFDINKDGKVDFKDFIDLILPLLKNLADNNGKIKQEDVIKTTSEVLVKLI